MCMDYISLLASVGRIVFGGYFALMGFRHLSNVDMLAGYTKSKNVPSPKAAVIVSGLLLLIGGLGVVLNMYVPYAALLLLVFLVPTTLMMHAFWSVTDPASKMGDEINFMKNVALVGATLMLLV